MISVNEALARITGPLQPVATEIVPLAEGVGRVLAEDIVARRTHPPTAVSAMDGYAVRAVDVAVVPVALTIVGEAPAGGAYDSTVGAGEAVRIFTGGPLPDGTDAIVMQELASREGNTVSINKSVPVHEFVRPAGLDFSAGDPGPRAGQVLTPRAIGVIAAMDSPRVRVRCRPRIALLASGDELVAPGKAVSAHQIVNSNSHALAALVRANGGEPIDLGIASDTSESLQKLAAGAEGTDLLITLGGASVGDHDLVQKALGDKGLEVNFWKVAMRPGKPMISGTFGSTAMIGLPGNPVSAMVCGLIFVIPALRKLLGLNADPIIREWAQLGTPLTANGHREAYLRGDCCRADDGVLLASPFDLQDSSVQSGLAEANCLIVQPPDGPAMETGEQIEIIPLNKIVTQF